MKKFIQWVKNFFCRHIDYSDNRNYKMPFLGYSFKCPKCNKYVAYFKEWNSYGNISKEDYDLFVKEGEKLYKMLPNYRRNKMIWNVYNHDINRREIKTYNVFKHRSFREDVEKLLKENLTYEEFSEKLNRTAQYYFWAKAEYEIVITSWVPHIDNEELDRLNADRAERETRAYSVNLDVGEKVDFYDQLHLNWEQFCKYVYGFSQLQKDNRGKDI